MNAWLIVAGLIVIVVVLICGIIYVAFEDLDNE